MARERMLRPIIGDRAWVADAACRGCDTDLFYPERGELTSDAKAVCDGCVVRGDCLEYALVNLETCGIWGGKSEKQRRSIRRRRLREGTIVKLASGPTARCGSEAGYARHRRNGEPACRLCLDAAAQRKQLRSVGA